MNKKSQVKKSNYFQSRNDKTHCPIRCIGCEHTKKTGKHSKIQKHPQALWWHTWQCKSFELIAFPTRKFQIQILEKICSAIKAGKPVSSVTEAKEWGMLVQ